MSRPPWAAEVEVGPALAAALIDEAFPSLAPARVEPLGAGWDNTAHRVNGDLVFRFPRRAVAAAPIRTEAGLLPALAPRLPLPVPVPRWVAAPGPRFPWPFAGYRMLAGAPAPGARLDGSGRAALAAPLGTFLRVLHAVPVEEARALGAPPDTLRRLDAAHRLPGLRERAAAAHALGLVDDPAGLIALAERAAAVAGPRPLAPVHGDLHASHLLVRDGALAGIIDWGDVHVGDPAGDLGIVLGFLPPPARPAFLAAYGPVEPDTWRLAGLKAVVHALALVMSARDAGDADVLREARASAAMLAREARAGA
ncbi:MAG: phosphotransferase [Thermoleophilia bacterium]|nr:phosphotransferase [Thermoleophilia bacterium]